MSQAKGTDTSDKPASREDTGSRRQRKGLGDIELDSDTLMKQRRAGATLKKEADHSHVGQGAMSQVLNLLLRLFFFFQSLFRDAISCGRYTVEQR